MPYGIAPCLASIRKNLKLMKTNYNLSIPTPCAKPWASFTTTSTGGFCTSCSKTVIDFTRMSDNQILQFINQNPQQVCGRFRSEQLKEYRSIEPVKIKPGSLLLKAGILSLFLVLTTKPGSAQTSLLYAQKETVQTSAHPDERTILSINDRIVRGLVKSSDESWL